MLAEALIRRFSAAKTLGEATTGQRLTGFLSIAIAQVESAFQERARSGRMYRAIGGTTGIAPVQAVPTAAGACWALWNPDPNNSLIVDTVDFFLLSGTAVWGGAILGIVCPVTATLPGAATGSTIMNVSGGGGQSKAIFASAYTTPTPVAQNQWFVLPMTSQPAGIAGVGGCFSSAVRGSIIVPPNKILGLNFLAGVGTSPLYIPGVTYTEAQIDLE